MSNKQIIKELEAIYALADALKEKAARLMANPGEFSSLAPKGVIQKWCFKGSLQKPSFKDIKKAASAN